MARLTRASLLDVLATVLVVVIVTAPTLFTSSGFSLDFTNHLWISWAAGRALVESGHPSFFLNTTDLGVFYPLFAFYGGTLYTLTGGIGELLADHVIVAYIGMTMLGIAGAYGGMLWLARQLGVRGWSAHAPALTVVTSAYYVTNLYGRGAWPELIATSAIAPLLASCVYLVRAPRWKPLPMVILAASTVIFSGSHNITLLWGTTMIVLSLLVMWLAFGAPRHLPYRRLAMVSGVTVTSALINAWFLFPDLAFNKDVAISNEATTNWASTSFLNAPGLLLDPLRRVPVQSGTPGLFVQIPDWFLAWGVATGALLLWRRSGIVGLRRAWLGVAILIALVFAMMTLAAFWEVVPFPFDQIQFPYRLGSYMFYAVAGLVLIGTLAVQRASATTRLSTQVAGLRIALLAAALVSLGLCVWQEWVPNVKVAKSYVNRSEALVSVNILPNSWYDGGSFRDYLAPQVPVPDERELLIEPGQVHGERFVALMNAPPGLAPIATNIKGGSYLVRIAGGLEKVGDNPYGEAVVKRVTEGSGPVEVVIETAHSAVVELGRVTSVLALLAILVVILGAGVRARRARRTEEADRGSLDPLERVGAVTS
jgi:hypothetical protein